MRWDVHAVTSAVAYNKLVPMVPVFATFTTCVPTDVQVSGPTTTHVLICNVVPRNPSPGLALFVLLRHAVILNVIQQQSLSACQRQGLAWQTRLAI